MDSWHNLDFTLYCHSSSISRKRLRYYKYYNACAKNAFTIHYLYHFLCIRTFEIMYVFNLQFIQHKWCELLSTVLPFSCIGTEKHFVTTIPNFIKQILLIVKDFCFLHSNVKLKGWLQEVVMCFS